MAKSSAAHHLEGDAHEETRSLEVLFHVEEHLTDVVLTRNGEARDRIRIESNRELVERLLPAVEELLSRRDVLPQDVSDIRVESDLPHGYSSRRIAETIRNVWTWFRQARASRS